MALEGLDQIRESAPAGADLTASRYRLVTLNSSGALVLAGAGAHGWPLDEGGDTGEASTFVLSGKAKVIVGDDTITPGMRLAADANGAVVEATGANFVSAIALEGGAQNQIIKVFPVTAQLNTTT